MNSPLQFFIAALYTTAITTSILGLLVYFYNRKIALNRIFCLYSLSIAWWSFCQIGLISQSDKAVALTWGRVEQIGVFFIPTLFIHFISLLVQRPLRKWVLQFAYTVSIVFALTALTPYLIADASPKFFVKYFATPGPLYPFAVLYFIAGIIYGHYKLHNAYSRSIGIKRNQMSYLFWSSLVGYIGGAANFLFVFDISIPFVNPYGTFAVPLYVIVTTYAIMRYRLMDITLVFQKGLAYGLLLGALIPAYILILGLEWLFTGTRQYLLSGILLVTFTIFPGVLVNLQKRLETAVGKALFPTKYDAHDALNEFSTAMRSILDLKALAKKTLSILSQALGVEKISIFLLDEERDEYVLAAAHGVNEIRLQAIRLTPKDLLPQYLQERGQVVLKEELEHSGKSLGVFGKGITDMLEELESELCLPLQSQGRLIGFVNLGHKPHRTMFTEDELNTLSILAASAASAFANASFHQTEKEAQRREKYEERAHALELIAGGFAHEVRNPLVSIKTFLQLVPLQKDDPEFMDGFLKTVLHDCERIELLSGETLHFARLHEPRRKEENLNEIILSSLRAIEQRALTKAVALVTELAPDLPLVWIDSQQIPQVLTNLQINALDAMGTNGGGRLSTMTRRLAKPNGVWVQLEITDTGCGMTADTLDHIFVPFYTTKHESKEREGTGLGLCICQRIVEAHGGYMEVKSEVGKGTSFFVNLPVRQLQKESAEKV